jgi:hypothetical protein
MKPKEKKKYEKRWLVYPPALYELAKEKLSRTYLIIKDKHVKP